MDTNAKKFKSAKKLQDAIQKEKIKEMKEAEEKEFAEHASAKKQKAEEQFQRDLKHFNETLKKSSAGLEKEMMVNKQIEMCLEEFGNKMQEKDRLRDEQKQQRVEKVRVYLSEVENKKRQASEHQADQ